MDKESPLDEMTEEKMEKLTKELSLVILPQLLVNNGLYEDYIANEKRALKKLYNYIEKDKERLDSGEMAVIYYNYNEYLQIGKNLISKTYTEKEKRIVYPILFTTFFNWIEGQINHFVSAELEEKGIQIEETYRILEKLRIEDKLGWLSKILVEEDIRNNPIWGEICKAKKIRDYLTHQKPMSEKTRNKYEDVTEDKLVKLLGTLKELIHLLKKKSSNNVKEREKKIEIIRNRMKEKYNILERVKKMNKDMKE